jgi:hypothetical protein
MRPPRASAEPTELKSTLDALHVLAALVLLDDDLAAWTGHAEESFPQLRQLVIPPSLETLA